MQRYAAPWRHPPTGGNSGGGVVGSSGLASHGGAPVPDVSAANYVSLAPTVAADASDREVNQLLRELECSVEGPHAAAVMRDAVWAIEHRAFLNCDPMKRDLFLEQRIRDVLSELSRTSNPKLLLLAVDFIDALLIVPYTNPQQKFTRLCRSLFIVLHCGIEKPAKEAQRVLKRMLVLDLEFGSSDPPLKSFIVKELKDNCELSLIQLHGRAQQTKAPFVAQFLAVMLALAATAEVNSRYLAGPLRQHAVQLATALAGSSDEVLRHAAYDCLVAIFSHTSALRQNEIILENRRVLDDAIRSLNTSHNNESSIISTLQSLRALITSRSGHFMEKQVPILPQICVLVTEQHRVSKSQAVRAAVCDLVPVIAETDVVSPARRIAYCAIIMEPVKNVRDERKKSLELRNVATFIQNVGYEVLDSTNRTNLDSIIMRYTTRRETQSECWHILSAICSSHARLAWKRLQHSSRSGWSVTASKNESISGMASSSAQDATLNGGSDAMGTISSMTGRSGNQATAVRQQEIIQHVDSLVRRCIPHLADAVLSPELVRYITIIKEHVSSVSMELQMAMDTLVESKLKDDVNDPKQMRVHNGSGSGGGGAVVSGSVGNGRLNMPLKSSDGTTNSAAGGSCYNASAAPSVGGINAAACGDGGASNNTNNNNNNNSSSTNNNNVGIHQPVTPPELCIALEVFSKRQITSVQQLEEIRTSIIHYQRHADTSVREQCSMCIIESLTQWIHYANQHRTSTYSTRVTEILELYLKHTIMELDPEVRLLGISLLLQATDLRIFLLDQRLLKIIMNFLYDTSCVREKVVELLVHLSQESYPTSSIEYLQQHLFVLVESCLIVLEYSTDIPLIIRHTSDLQILAKFSLQPLLHYMHRIFIAFKKQLLDDMISDTIAITILKTINIILSIIIKEEKLILSYQDDIMELYDPIIGILRGSTSLSLSYITIRVLVKMHTIGSSPKEWNAVQLHEILQSITSIYIGNNNNKEEELKEILTLFGQLGAVDPSSRQDVMNVNKKKDGEAAIQDEADLELTYDYTVIVYRDLSRMLDVSLPEMVCTQALRTLLHLIQTTSDRKELIGGCHAAKAVLQIIKRTNETPTLRIEALHILAAITSLRHEKISKTLLPEIVVLLEQLWYPLDYALFRAVLDVVSSLRPGKLSGKEQLEVWPWLYPRLVDVALQDHTESKEFSLRVIDIVLHASYIPPHCISIIFSMLMQFIQQLDQLIEVRVLSLCASIHIVCNLKAGKYLTSLLHSIRILTRHCLLSEDLSPRLSTPMVQDSLRILSTMYINSKLIINALCEHLKNVEEPQSVGGNTPLRRHENGMDFAGQIHHDSPQTPYMKRYQQKHQRELRHGGNHYHLMDAADVDAADDDHHYGAYSQGQQDITLFMKHVEYGLRAKDNNKWREWFTEFQKNLIAVSPHPAFRMIVDLFDKHEPLRRKLFHPSFKCFYESLSAEYMKRVNEVLNLALHCNDSEVISKCLGLADYLDHNPPSIKEPTLQQLRFLESHDHSHHQQQQQKQRSENNNDSSNNNNNNNNSDHNNNNNVKNTSTTSVKIQNMSQQKTFSDNFDFESLPQSQQSLIADTFMDSKNTVSNCLENLASESNNNNNNNNSGEGAAGEDNKGTAATQDPSNVKGMEGVGDKDFSESVTEFKPMAHLTTSKGKKRGEGVDGNEAETEGKEDQKEDNSMTCPRASIIPNSVNPIFSTDSLVEAALRTRMYDKVISYLENKVLPVIEKYRYTNGVPKETIHASILPLAELYSKREMQDSVVGLFCAIRYKTENDDGLNYELLQWWDVAQLVYAGKVEKGNNKYNLVDFEGYVRTLCLCGEWEKALHVIKMASPQLTRSSASIAQSGAMAAWILGEWNDVKQLKECIPVKEKVDKTIRLFFENAIYLHEEFHNNSSNNSGEDNMSIAIERLHATISRAKVSVDESLKTLLPLSYAHAYENLTLLQHFTEMEEQILYMQSKSPVFREQLLERWKQRFAALKPDSLMPSLRSLMLHSLILKPNEMSDMILNFCERMGTTYPQLSMWAMSWLQKGQFPRSSIEYKRNNATSIKLISQPWVALVYISQIWSEGKRKKAILMMEDFLDKTRPTLEEEQTLCYGTAQHRLGIWKQEMRADSFWKHDYRQEILHHFHEAIRALPKSYEAWHSWGLINYRVQQRDRSLSTDDQHLFVEAAHQGFVAAICRSASPSTAFPGIMRLLQLWVLYDGVSMLKESVADSIFRIPTDYWVQAIPQLIGHLSDTQHDMREVISMILRQLCNIHAQAVVFPLLVVFMSDDGNGGPQLRRRELAESIMTNLPNRILSDAKLLAKLLVDVSAIPIEKIREHLNAIATAWNPNAEYEEDPEEVRRRLRVVLDIFNAHKQHLLYTVGDIGLYVGMVLEDEKQGRREKASSIITQLVDEINKHITEKLGKEPQKAMEPLLNLRNLSIAVFGEYDIQYTNFPTIISFSSKLDVIPSKKRPRRIRLNGSNGFIYTYCLKGNEDIRMDERVMQLFGMVNVLLTDAHISNSAFIHRFPVIPISNNVGLLGWVENANTINNTICMHRSTISHICTHQESNTLRSYVDSFGSWEKLTMIQRTEALDYIMTLPDCEAVDVARAMWHRSHTAEQWLERRTAFTLSLATMSMVGYILGLGDRHLGNILLSMSTGKIVHIDFDDSFDVGRLRHVLPETIPFRLTRMLTNAMEVFGVDGMFRASCTRTQTTLHKNSDSIMALLSAFLHDPIVQHKGRMKNMMEKSRTPQDIAERIRNKLRGTEMAVANEDLIIYNTVPESSRRPDLLYMSNAFNDVARRSFSKSLTPQKQVSMLIDEATRVENFAALYFGWGPLW